MRFVERRLPVPAIRVMWKPLIQTVLAMSAATVLVHAQPPAPNAKGVSMGHVHLVAKDPQGVKSLWVSVLGATAANHASLDGVRVPGMYVWIEKGEPSGGTDGSPIRDLGLRVRDLEAVLVRAAAAGLDGRRVSRDAAHLIMPDGVLLELIGDPSLPTEIATDHIHLIVTNASAARDWYAKRFGDVIPGIRLFFISAESPGAPTKGRAVDHIGFEVRPIESFVSGLEAAGTTFETPLKRESDIKQAFLVDPWGTRIELTEGLARHTP